jgi:putative RecB family exonuclease
MNTPAASPPERSEQDIITALQATVSASRLSLFLQCRLKFYFRYVLKLKKPKTASLHLGNAVHAVLKAWNKARWVQQPLSLKVVHETYQTAWADNTEGSVEWEPGEEEADKTTGWRLLDTYLRESHVPAEIRPDAVEVPVDADLQQHGLPRLIGILDLVQQRQIIDYKTSATTPNADRRWPTTSRSPRPTTSKRNCASYGASRARMPRKSICKTGYAKHVPEASSRSRSSQTLC